MIGEYQENDQVDVVHTVQANELTLLEYLQLGVFLLIVGVAIICFSVRDWYWDVGGASFLIGCTVILVGSIRYRKMHKRLSRIQRLRETR